MLTTKTTGVYWLALVMSLLFGLPLAAQEPAHHAVAFGFSQPLGDLAKVPQPLQFGFREVNPIRLISKRSPASASCSLSPAGSRPTNRSS